MGLGIFGGKAKTARNDKLGLALGSRTVKSKKKRTVTSANRKRTKTPKGRLHARPAKL